jgi:hypothetical protein
MSKVKEQLMPKYNNEAVSCDLLKGVEVRADVNVSNTSLMLDIYDHMDKKGMGVTLNKETALSLLVQLEQLVKELD